MNQPKNRRRHPWKGLSWYLGKSLEILVHIIDSGGVITPEGPVAWCAWPSTEGGVAMLQ